MATKQANIPVLNTSIGRRHAVPVVLVDERGDAVGPGAQEVRAAAITRYLTATNGDTFPDDSQTSYTYDESGVNISTITKTTVSGAVYVQTWIRSGTQLGSKSGWVKQ